MTWYYVKEGAPAGPISDEELLSKLRVGAILPTTLVWSAGMSEWQAAASITDRLAPAPPMESAAPPGLAGSIATPAHSISGTPPVLPFFFCTCCGTIIPADQLVRIDSRAVCAACKPGYLQKIQEGVMAPVRVPVLAAMDTSLAAQIPAARPYAGFWIRALACIVDNVIFLAVCFGIEQAAGVNFSQSTGWEDMDLNVGDISILSLEILLGTAYEVVLVAKYGGTLGKLLCRIRVLTAGGERLGYGHSCLRALAKWVSVLPCGLGFVMSAFDVQKRALHDFMCNTRVMPAK